MSEVIENYIKRHPGLSEKDAFEGFLNEDRIKAWVGTDDSRKERLRKEFGRVWGSMHVEGQVASPGGARSGPAGPSGLQQARTVRVEVAPESVTGQGGSPARKLSVLCSNCKHMDVWMQGDTIQCHRCGRYFEDMLSLVRVTPVGPFAFLFGEGWKGAATAGGIVVGLGLLYLLLTRVL